MDIAKMLAQAEQDQPEKEVTYERQEMSLPPISDQYVKQLRAKLAQGPREHLDADYKLYQRFEEQLLEICRAAVESVTDSGVVGSMTRKLLNIYHHPCTWRVCDRCNGTGEDKHVGACLGCKGAGYHA